MVEAALKTLLSLGLVATATAYVRGWRRLRAAGYARRVWRPASYALGLAFVAGALLSPLDELAAERFSAHMAQHLLLTMMAAPLLCSETRCRRSCGDCRPARGGGSRRPFDGRRG